AARFKLTSIETQPEAARGWTRSAERRRRRTQVRRIQLTYHQVEQPAHLVWCLRAGHERFVVRANLLPVHAVKIGIIEMVAQVGPTLPEHFHLLLREVDIHFRRDRNRTRSSLEVHRADPTIIKIEDLLAVRRELR